MTTDTLAPWETYDEELDPLRGCSDELKAEVEAYSKRRHTRTSTQNAEELCRQREISNESVKKFRFEKQDELKDEKARFGRVMHHAEFLSRLRDVIPARYNDFSLRGLIGLSVLVPTNHGGRWEYVCAVQLGYAPEYSQLHFDEHNLPLNEKYRGWRTVLLRLITGGYITEDQANESFGEPTSGPVSGRYRSQLYAFRNR